MENFKELLNLKKLINLILNIIIKIIKDLNILLYD